PMGIAQALRDDEVEVLTERRRGAVAEQLRRGAVPPPDDAGGVGIDHGIGNLLDDRVSERRWIARGLLHRLLPSTYSENGPSPRIDSAPLENAYADKNTSDSKLKKPQRRAGKRRRF